MKQFVLTVIIVVGVGMSTAGFAFPDACPSLDVHIDYSLDLGDTVADAEGTHRYYFGIENHDYEQIFIPPYWGTYPLYFFGANVGITGTVTRFDETDCVGGQGEPQSKPMRLWVSGEYFKLNTDGTSGAELTNPVLLEIELLPGESYYFDASFVADYQPGLEEGLSRFLVKIYKLKKSGKIGKILLVHDSIFGL